MVISWTRKTEPGMKILAATDFSTRSQRALRRAGLLARNVAAELTLVHVVDDDQPSAIVRLETREARRYLAEQMTSIAELKGLQCDFAVVTGNPFRGILNAAEARGVDLIVMGAHRKQLLRDVFVGTTIERVIRTGQFPVLMVNAEVEHSYKKVMAAVDMSEPSARAISTAKETGLIGEASFSLVHGFDAFAKGKMSNAGIGKDELASYVATERSQVEKELIAFLEANDFDVDNWSLQIREGGPVEAIMEAINEVAPDLLVIGTHSRSGFIKLFLGSVTESLLRSVDVDVFAVPPIRS
ncbi:universal stress protein [Mesorhizobium sp. AA23]|nr:universal stress protein [Mesorhizobium sp. AA23]